MTMGPKRHRVECQPLPRRGGPRQPEFALALAEEPRGSRSPTEARGRRFIRRWRLSGGGFASDGWGCVSRRAAGCDDGERAAAVHWAIIEGSGLSSAASRGGVFAPLPRARSGSASGRVWRLGLGEAELRGPLGQDGPGNRDLNGGRRHVQATSLPMNIPFYMTIRAG